MCSSKSTRRSVSCAERAGLAEMAVDAVDVGVALARSRSASARVRSSSIAAASRSISSSERSVEILNGESFASQRISFACARPMPAIARWSRSSGWSWRRSRRRISPSSLRPEAERVGAEMRELVLEPLGREEPDAGALLLARLGEHELAAVLEREPEHRRLRGLRAGCVVAEAPGAHQVDAQDELAVRRREEQVLAAALARPRTPSRERGERRLERLHASRCAPGRCARPGDARDERVELAHPRLDFR